MFFLPASGYRLEAFRAKLPPPCLPLPDEESVRHEVHEDTAYNTVPVLATLILFLSLAAIILFLSLAAILVAHSTATHQQ